MQGIGVSGEVVLRGFAVLRGCSDRPASAAADRQLARITGASPGSLHRELSALTELGLLLRQVTGRQVNYRANRACPVYEDLAGFLRKTAGVADILRETFATLGNRVSLAFVYGSVAAGREGPRSDIDVTALGRAGFAPVVAALAPVQEKLRREVNPTVMKPEEFARKLRTHDGFVINLMREPKIWLIGNDDDLAKLAKNRAA